MDKPSPRAILDDLEANTLKTFKRSTDVESLKKLILDEIEDRKKEIIKKDILSRDTESLLDILKRLEGLDDDGQNREGEPNVGAPEKGETTTNKRRHDSGNAKTNSGRSKKKRHR